MNKVYRYEHLCIQLILRAIVFYLIQKYSKASVMPNPGQKPQASPKAQIRTQRKCSVYLYMTKTWNKGVSKANNHKIGKSYLGKV